MCSKVEEEWDFPDGLVVKTPPFRRRGQWVRSLVRQRELTAAKTEAGSAGSPRSLLLAPSCERRAQNIPEVECTRDSPSHVLERELWVLSRVHLLLLWSVI